MLYKMTDLGSVELESEGCLREGRRLSKYRRG